jgi:predicted RNA binding protein YcfA (HicA-like mRNA interferase family)
MPGHTRDRLLERRNRSLRITLVEAHGAERVPRVRGALARVDVPIALDDSSRSSAAIAPRTSPCAKRSSPSSRYSPTPANRGRFDEPASTRCCSSCAAKRAGFIKLRTGKGSHLHLVNTTPRQRIVVTNHATQEAGNLGTRILREAGIK